jgi:hypothetical protein
MLEPSGFDGFRDAVALQSFLEYLFAAGEMSTHYRVFGVSLIERPPLVFNLGAEKCRRELIFQLLDPLFIGVAKKETDHAVGEDPIDEITDYAP